MLPPECGKVNLDRIPCAGYVLRLTRGLPMQPTYRPRNKRRIRRHGFRARMKTRWGREVLNRRRKKGRRRLAVKLPSKHGAA